MTTFHIRVEQTADVGDLEQRLEALDRGEDIEPTEPVLSVESLATLGRILRPTNLDVLQAIVEHDPESIRALARALNRSPSEVANNVNELAEYDLLRLEQDGRAKRPVVWYDELDIDIPFTDSNGSVDAAVP